MIFDQLDSTTTLLLQKGSPVLREAFGWLKAMPANPEHGIFELRGKLFYVNVHGYDTAPAGQCVWESHRHTVDIQYCISGGEIVEWQPPSGLQRSGEYNPDKDAEKWLDCPGDRVTIRMQPGFFAVFLPGELHRPKVADGVHAHVEKLVVKIDAELLGL